MRCADSLLRVPRCVEKAFLEAGERQGWRQSDAQLVVAVSGGGDSLALLLLFATLWHRERLVVAHMEHGIRGEDSLADARCVAAWARKLGIPFVMERGNIPERRLQGEGIEEAARRIRYAFLDKVRFAWGARWVATAHTLDDKAESVLHHALRGTGIHGLVGIPEQRSGYVRPLIRVEGGVLRQMLRNSSIEWCEDLTNRETKYLRNRIRREILPYLAESVNARAISHLAALGEEAHDVELLRAKHTEALLPYLRCRFPYGKRVWSLAMARRLRDHELRHAIRDEGMSLHLPSLSRKRLEELAHLVRSSGRWRFQWSGEEELFCGGGLLCWGTRAMLTAPPNVELNLVDECGEFSWGRWRFLWNKEDVASAPVFKMGTFSAVFPSETDLVRVVVTSVECAERQEKEHVPWWCRADSPVLFLSGASSWIPLWDNRNNDADSVPRSFASIRNHARITRFASIPKISPP